MSAVSPPRPTPAEVESELTEHVRALAGPDATPRPEQIHAVTAALSEGHRTLLVARTGFGKSAVYFSATRMLRDRGWGPTLVVSPLLALMRDQVEAAGRLGLSAATINSSNLDEWGEVEEAIDHDRIDLLLIAPERLAHPGFRERVFATLLDRPISLVCDEAHCISDWGHDFRPDYLRLRRLLDELPPDTPVLATTATANDRVTADVASQLGSDTVILRTSLDRASLRLSVVELDSQAQRWAFIADAIPRCEGSGIVYTLTVEAAEKLAEYLAEQGIAAAAYTGSTDPEVREHLEADLKSNRLDALVATSALGMGFDKPDLAFCIHLGLPPSPVSYYQQIGRAGRAIEVAEVIALPRPEDRAIWSWFESVSLPSEEQCRQVLDRLSPTKPTTLPRLESAVNLSRGRLGTLLDILDVQGAISRGRSGWLLTDPSWRYDADLAERLRDLRRAEQAEMTAFVTEPGCRLDFLRRRLDDAESGDCGRCDRCTPRSWPDPPAALVGAATTALRGHDVAIEPRRQWPSGLDEPRGRLAPDRQNERGRTLSRDGDGGWDAEVGRLLDAAGADASLDLASSEVVSGLVAVLRRWDWGQRPTWICPLPSRRRQALIDAIAAELGRIGSLPIHHAVRWHDTGGSAGFQADQANSAHQVANLWGRLEVVHAELPARPVLDGPALMIDDTVSSRWTLTVAGFLLRDAGSGPILPLVLRQA